MFVQNIENRSNHFYSLYGKRIFDLIVSSAMLVVLSPLFFVISVIVKFGSKGPVFYSQKRMGKNWNVFTLYKFRSMEENSESRGPGITALNDSRITPVGGFLRKYKLDEIPQLLNVFKGDMSLVGPRPESLKYVEMFKDEYKDILQISPGLTDYALIEYRNEEEVLSKYDDVEKAYATLILPDKIRLYRRYIREMSFIVDLKILFRTVLGVIGT